jgi:glutamine phosphoribosylpyrophosphate amidotransferase
MTKDEIIRMAREAGLPIDRDDDGEYIGCLDFFNREELVKSIAKAEREACAKVCEGRYKWSNVDERLAVNECIAAIRARG